MAKRDRAKNIVSRPPTKKHVLPDGTIRTEKLCPIPLNRKMVDPDGNVVCVVLANGYSIRQMDAYGTMILANKLAAGFIPYAECPIASGRIRDNRAKPCAGSDGRGKFSEQECCEHINAIVTKRRAVKKKKCDAFAARFQNKESALIDYIQHMTRDADPPVASPEAKKPIV